MARKRCVCARACVCVCIEEVSCLMEWGMQGRVHLTGFSLPRVLKFEHLHALSQFCMVHHVHVVCCTMQRCNTVTLHSRGVPY